MTQGFHPRPKMSFPLALSVGIEAQEEVAEVVLTGDVTANDLSEQLNQHAVPGLVIGEIQVLEGNAAKAQVTSVTYELKIPAHRLDSARAAVNQLNQTEEYFIQRKGRDEPIELCSRLEELTLSDNLLRFRLNNSHQVGVRPREILDALELSELEHEGYWLTRTEVELAS